MSDQTQKHTPGPWHVLPPTHQCPSRAMVIRGWTSIYDAPLTEETAANARLIAASPDFLAACTPERLQALETLAEHTNDPDARQTLMIVARFIADLRAAVTRATTGDAVGQREAGE